MLWTVNCGNGRVFVTELGHDLDAMKSAGFAATLTRGASYRNCHHPAAGGFGGRSCPVQFRGSSRGQKSHAAYCASHLFKNARPDSTRISCPPSGSPVRFGPAYQASGNALPRPGTPRSPGATRRCRPSCIGSGSSAPETVTAAKNIADTLVRNMAPPRSSILQERA